MYKIGIIHGKQIPKRLYIHKNGRLILIAAKAVDEIKGTGRECHINRFVGEFNKRFKRGTVVNGPGKMRFFVINVEQADVLQFKPMLILN